MSVLLDGKVRSTTATDGQYAFDAPGAGPHRVEFEKSGYAQAIAINVPAPSSGIVVNAELEDAFTPLLAAGITYVTYIDYSEGRTLLHLVRLPRTGTRTWVHTPVYHATAMDAATGVQALVTVNGGYFNAHEWRPVRARGTGPRAPSRHSSRPRGRAPFSPSRPRRSG